MASPLPASLPTVNYIDLPEISNQPATPSGLDADTSSNLVFVACQLDPGYVYVIDANANPPKLQSSTPIAIGPYPHGVAVNSTTHFVFVANTGTSQAGSSSKQGNNTVSVLGYNSDTSAWEELFQFEVGSANCDPHGVAVDAGLNYLFVANQKANNVTVFDCSPLPAAPPKPLYTIPVGSTANPHGIGVDSNLHRVFVACRDANQVAVIDGVAGTVLAMVAVGNQPTGIGIDSQSGVAYASNNADNTVSLIGAAPPWSVTTIDGFNGPDRFAVDEPRGVVYAGNNPATAPTPAPASTVSAILTKQNNQLDDIGVPGSAANGVSAPTEMAYLPGPQCVYVALQNSNQVAYFPPIAPNS